MYQRISVRIPNETYDKMAAHEADISTITRKALDQYFRRKEPNQNLDQIVMESYDRRIKDLTETNIYLKHQIEDWKKVSIMNSSFWQILKMKLLKDTNEKYYLE